MLKKFLVVLIVTGCLTFPRLSYTQNAPSAGTVAIEIEGRLVQAQPGTEKQLVLHSRDGRGYLIEGGFQEELNKLYGRLKSANIVRLRGTVAAHYTIICSRQNEFRTNKDGSPDTAIQIACYRLYPLQVEQIISAAASSEIIPEPERDTAQEKQTLSLMGREEVTPLVYGEIYGTIKKINMRSPIKTLEIENSDQDSPLKKITLHIGQKTQIVKPTPDGEGIRLFKEQLRVGQQVSATYVRSETKTEGLFITVMRE